MVGWMEIYKRWLFILTLCLCLSGEWIIRSYLLWGRKLLKCSVYSGMGLFDSVTP